MPLRGEVAGRDAARLNAVALEERHPLDARNAERSWGAPPMGRSTDVVETTKWSRPFFDYRGSPLCFMSASKAHCGFGFWRGKELAGLPERQGEAFWLRCVEQLSSAEVAEQLGTDAI